jgi:glutaredoxin
MPSPAADLGRAGAAAGRPRAVIARMLTPEHVCPSGLRALDLLRRRGFAVEDRPLRSRAEIEAFKAEHGVATTPQIWIGDERIGGHEALRRHLGLAVRDPKATTYVPVIAIFGMAAALTAAFAWSVMEPLLSLHSLQWFLGLATALLALQKLRDIEGFANGFLGYDLLAQRWPAYAFAYPWLEAAVGVLMVAGTLHWLWAPVALVIGGVGAVSVVKAVYLDRRSLRCACVGGGSNVPLGFVSLVENLVMVAMGVWMLAAPM